MALDEWHKGRTSIYVEVLCCPMCGSVEVRYRGKAEKDREAVYWACIICHHRWKGTKPRAGRATRI